MRRLRQREPDRCGIIKANRASRASGDYIPPLCLKCCGNAGCGVTKAKDEDMGHGGALADIRSPDPD